MSSHLRGREGPSTVAIPRVPARAAVMHKPDAAAFQHATRGAWINTLIASDMFTSLLRPADAQQS